MNVMQKAHQWARGHREEFDSYRAALSEGLRVAHAEAKAAREEKSPQVEPTRGKVLYQAREVPADEAVRIMSEGVKRYRDERRPFLCRDWKSPDYDGRRDFVRGGWW